MTSEAVAQPTTRMARRVGWSWAPLLVAVLPCVAVTAVAAANGGFNATSFGWTALAFGWVVIVTVVFSAPAWGVLDASWLILAAALSTYAFASAAWAGSAAQAVDDGLRSLVYLGAIAGALLLLRRGRLTFWLSGAVFGATAVSIYSLGTRLFPDRFVGAFNGDAGYRLFVPIGYWNALGIFSVIGALIGIGVAAFGRGRVLRIASAASLVPLTATTYFTFSRGAWIAFGLGLVATLVLSGQRLRLLAALGAFVPVPALGVLLASRSSTLTHGSVALGAASHPGHHLAVELVLLVVAQLAVAATYVLWVGRIAVAPSARRVTAAVLLVAAIAALVAVFSAYGSPSTLARHAYDSFVSAPTSGTDLNGRLFSLSNNGRTVLWRAALDDFDAHPVAGSGAGSFGRWWLAHRSSAYFVQDAHNLYLQTLAEGGVVGAALLALFLAVPLAAALRARRHPLVAPACGAYVAFLAHAVVDWDWQMPAVTLLALFAGAVPVVAARPREPWRLPVWARGAIGVASAAVAAIAFIGLIGNLALARSQSAVLDGRLHNALDAAESAHRWAPWSATALRQVGETRVLAGDRSAGLKALRTSLAKDAGDWQTWFDVAAVSSGKERQTALAHVRALNRFAPPLIKSR